MEDFSIAFKGEIFYWRGPSPFHFVELSPQASKKIKEHQGQLTYGWGVIPTTAIANKFEWTTALIPKEGIYFLPIKDLVRKKLDLGIGDLLAGKLIFTLKKQ